MGEHRRRLLKRERLSRSPNLVARFGQRRLRSESRESNAERDEERLRLHSPTIRRAVTLVKRTHRARKDGQSPPSKS